MCVRACDLFYFVCLGCRAEPNTHTHTQALPEDAYATSYVIHRSETHHLESLAAVCVCVCAHLCAVIGSSKGV